MWIFKILFLILLFLFILGLNFQFFRTDRVTVVPTFNFLSIISYYNIFATRNPIGYFIYRLNRVTSILMGFVYTVGKNPETRIIGKVIS